MKKYFWIALIAALVLVFSGCSDDNGKDAVKVKVTFDPNGGSGTATVVEVEKGKTVTPPAAPTRSGHTFVNWFETKDANPSTAAAFDFNTAINEDKTLYAIWRLGGGGGIPETPGGEIADVVLISGNNITYDFKDDYFVSMVKVDDVTAIKVEPDDEGGDTYRVEVQFFNNSLSTPKDATVNISKFGTFEMDFFTDTGYADISFVVSLFVGNSWEKVMLYATGSANGLTAEIGDGLWFLSRELQGIEIYSDKNTNFTNLYITRMELTGTAVPEPPEDEPVTATNTFMTTTKGATSGTNSIDVTADTDNDRKEGADYYKTVYVYFDAYGKDDLSTIEMKFTLTAEANSWKGNFTYLRAYNDDGEWDFSGSSNYIGWFGSGSADPINIKFDPDRRFATPISPNTAQSLDKSSINCISFEVQCSSGGTLALTSINFRPHLEE